VAKYNKDNIKQGNVAPCLLHGDIHELKRDCWLAIMGFMYDQEFNKGVSDLNKSLASYLSAVEKKMGRKIE